MQFTSLAHPIPSSPMSELQDTAGLSSTSLAGAAGAAAAVPGGFSETSDGLVQSL